MVACGAFAPVKLCLLPKRLSTGARPVLHDPDAAPHPSLSRDPDRNDWSIHEDGQEIGRLYEDLTASRPEIAWFRHGACAAQRQDRRTAADSDSGLV